MPKYSLISIPLDIPDVRVLKTETAADGHLVFVVESTLKTTTCQGCNQPITERRGEGAPRLLRHLPILGHVTYIQISPKVFRCSSCPGDTVTTQQLDWYSLDALHTIAYERYLILQLINSSITDVKIKEGLTDDTLVNTLSRWNTYKTVWEVGQVFTTLNIHEIVFMRGLLDYIVVVSGQTDDQYLRLLAVLPNRQQSTIADWLKTIPDINRTHITTVCTNMWEGYIKAIQEVMPLVEIKIHQLPIILHSPTNIENLSEKRDTYDYLYEIGTTGMTFVLGLLIAKVAEEFISLSSTFPTTSLNAIVVGATLLTILMQLISIIGTKSYAHIELGVPYRKSYFLVSLLLITLPLYIAVEAINRSFTPLTNNINRTTFVLGMTSLFITCIFSAGYILSVYALDNPKTNNNTRKIPFLRFLSVILFQVFGMVFCIISFFNDNPLILTIVALLALSMALFYLVFLWALQFKIWAR